MNMGSLHTKFQVYTLLCFEVTDNSKWLCGPEKLPGLSRNGLQVRNSNPGHIGEKPERSHHCAIPAYGRTITVEFYMYSKK